MWNVLWPKLSRERYLSNAPLFAYNMLTIDCWKCPLCHVSFVKSDGCNKLTCPCGYIMWYVFLATLVFLGRGLLRSSYVCRADIRTERYQHFCQHFRAIPGSQCTECEKCDLYAMEDEAAVIKTAAEKAEQEYFSNKGNASSVNFSHQAVGPDGKHILSSKFFHLPPLSPTPNTTNSLVGTFTGLVP
jgi:hypothetical protein